MPGPGQQPNMQQLMKQAQQLEQQMRATQEELAATEVEGHAAGGLVKATVSGAGELLALSIDPQVIDPDDAETLEDLVVAAVRDAAATAAKLAADKMGPLAAGLGGGLPGLGL
jgi:DNA-binding YbaB/EbfC family protein